MKVVYVCGNCRNTVEEELAEDAKAYDYKNKMCLECIGESMFGVMMMGTLVKGGE